MKIVFRYDDYSELSDVDFDLSVFRIIIEHGFNLMIGVIPFVAKEMDGKGYCTEQFSLSQSRIDLLKELPSEKVEIALHGYSHQNLSSNRLAEFCDEVEPDLQKEWISKGKKLLEDGFEKSIDWFIPPFNEYNESTLKALIKCGFAGISAGAVDGHLVDGLYYIQGTCGLYNLQHAIDYYEKDQEGYIIVQLHNYDFYNKSTLKGMTLNEFTRFVKKIRTRGYESASFDTLSRTEDCSVSRALVNQEIRRSLCSPVRFIVSKGIRRVYWSQSAGREKLNQLNEWNKWIGRGRKLFHWVGFRRE